MQLMPATARTLGVDAADLKGNIDGGVIYLGQMLKRFEGDLPRALAAYNAGPEAVARYGGVPPYAETQAYVRAILDRLGRRQRLPVAGRGRRWGRRGVTAMKPTTPRPLCSPWPPSKVWAPARPMPRRAIPRAPRR